MDESQSVQKLTFNDKLHIIGVEGTDALVNKVVSQLSENFSNISQEIVKYDSFANGETKVELNESVRGKFTYLICDRYGKYSPQNTKYNDRLMQELLLIQCAKNHGAKGISMGGIPEYGKKTGKSLPIYNQAESFESIFGPAYSTNTLETSNIDLLNPETNFVKSTIKEFEARNRMLPPQKEKIHLIGTQDTAGLVKSMKKYLINNLGDDVVSSENSLYNESDLGITQIDLKEPFVGKHVYVVADVNGRKNINGITMTYNDRLVQLFLLLKHAREYSAKTVNVVPTCFPYSRQDKPPQAGLKERAKREPSSAQFMANIMQNIFGVDYCITEDIHNPTVINNSEITNFVNLYTGWFVQKVINYLQKDNVVLCPMDEGGKKKSDKISEEMGLDNLTVIKTRSGVNKVDKIEVYGNVRGKDILVHDDILDTGGSLEKLIEKLHELGARSINVAITHGMFNNDAIDKLQKLHTKGWFEHIYITNTVYRDKEFYPDRVKLIDASLNFADPIKSIYLGESINYNFGVKR